jgi:flagellar operon protein
MITGLRPRPPELLPSPGGVRPHASLHGANFAQTLRESLAGTGLRFSAHAQERLAERGIRLDPDSMQRLAASTEAAAAKGARQSVVLLDGLAVVVGVPSRTVVTVLEPDAAQHAVFTNIDSVVLAGTARDGRSTATGPDPLGGGSRAADR